jgi:hypothetical protein
MGNAGSRRRSSSWLLDYLSSLISSAAAACAPTAQCSSSNNHSRRGSTNGSLCSSGSSRSSSLCWLYSLLGPLLPPTGADAARLKSALLLLAAGLATAVALAFIMATAAAGRLWLEGFMQAPAAGAAAGQAALVAVAASWNHLARHVMSTTVHGVLW